MRSTGHLAGIAYIVIGAAAITLALVLYFSLQGLMISVEAGITEYQGFWGSLARALIPQQQEQYQSALEILGLLRIAEVVIILIGIIGAGSMIYGLTQINKNINIVNQRTKQFSNPSAHRDSRVQPEHSQQNYLNKNINDIGHEDVSIPYKDSRKAALLAIVLGAFGILGLGHIYAGKKRTGAVLLSTGIVLDTIEIYSIFVLRDATWIAFGAAYSMLLIWQVIDAQKQARKFNILLHETGKKPW